jgi:phosphoribosylanthranilate isomerase
VGVFVKICGLCRAGDVEAVGALAPDAMGFVFWPRSPRAVTPGQVGDWTRGLPPGIRKVGVFVDASVTEIRRAVDEAGLDVVQLHGAETPELCKAFDVPVWKALHLDRLPDGPLSGYPVDAFLVDSYSSTSPGGTGIAADWQAAAAFVEDAPRRVLLAGGLTPRTVREAIRVVGPWGVDVSSGVEAAPGRKDMHRVGAFIEQCRIP